MSGVQGVGKTTYRKKHFSNYNVISFDDYITKSFSGDYNECYNQYAKLPILYREIIRQQVNLRFLELLKEEQNIVVDFVNPTNEQRLNWVKFVDREVYEVKLLVLDEELGTLLERNESRIGKLIPDFVIKDSFDKIEDANLYIDEIQERFDLIAIF